MGRREFPHCSNCGRPIRVIRAIRGSDLGCGLPRCEHSRRQEDLVDSEADLLRTTAMWHASGVEAPEFEAVTRRLSFRTGIFRSTVSGEILDVNPGRGGSLNNPIQEFA